MNKTLALVRYATVPGKGWRRGAAVLTKNGKLRPDVMVLGGTEVDCPKGRFQMRQYDGKRPVYTDLGNDASDAMARFRAEEAKHRARASALAAGLQLASPPLTTTPRRKTLQQLADAFIEKHENAPHRSDDSLRVYKQVTETFLERTLAVYPDEVTEEEVIKWHAWMRRECRYSDRTCSNYYKSLRGFFKYCRIDLAAVITEGTHKLLKSYTKRIPNTYTPEQVDALIAASGNENRALLWEFAYKVGLRDSELQMVTRFDLHGLDTDSPMVNVRERDEYGRIKDAEERAVELHPALVPKLKQWLLDNPEKVLLFGTVNDKPDTKMLLALKVTARRAGLNCGRCKGCQGKHNECGEFTLHRFRRTYVTRMLRATGGDLRSVMQRSGHSDIASVMRYLQPAESIRRAVAAAF